MEIESRRTDSVTLLDLKGNLTIGRSEESLREIIAKLLADGQKHILINLSGVPMIDSSGIGAMIKSYTSVKDAGGQIKLLKPPRLARQLLSITGLLSVLETFEDEAAAVASF
ncbi:MAG: STAS domain-containing protein [Acidobacteriota bacterium]